MTPEECHHQAGQRGVPCPGISSNMVLRIPPPPPRHESGSSDCRSQGTHLWISRAQPLAAEPNSSDIQPWDSCLCSDSAQGPGLLCRPQAQMGFHFCLFSDDECLKSSSGLWCCPWSGQFFYWSSKGEKSSKLCILNGTKKKSYLGSKSYLSYCNDFWPFHRPQYICSLSEA